MPARFIVHGMHRPPELRAGLKPCGMRHQHVFPAAIESLGCGQQRGHHHRGRMATHVGAAIVVIQYMRGHAIDQGGIQRAGAAGGAQHQ